METFIKKGNKLVRIGEGKLFTKGELSLVKEDNGIDANIDGANGIQQAQLKAKQLMNQNAGVNSAAIEAGKADGQNDQQILKKVAKRWPTHYFTFPSSSFAVISILLKENQRLPRSFNEAPM